MLFNKTKNRISKKRKKGFTLIELLSAIVIVTLVLGIGSVVYLKIIENSKEKATILAINNVKEAAYLYSKGDNEKKDWVSFYDVSGSIVGKYTCVSVQQLINKGYFKKNFFEKDIYLNKINKNTFVFVSVSNNSDDVKVNLSNSDDSNKKCLNSAINNVSYNLEFSNINTYTDAISFELKPKSSKVTADRYSCSYYDNDKWNDGSVNDNLCSFNGLKDGKEYKIKSCMVVDNKNYCDNISITTSNFKKPKIEIANNDSWKREKKINITYYDDNVQLDKAIHYFKSEVSGEVVSGNVFFSDSDTKVDKLNAGDLYRTDSSTISFVTSDNLAKSVDKKIDARIEDGSKNFEETSARVKKIDSVSPSCNISSDHSGPTKDKVTLTAFCDDNDGSGCKKSVYTATIDYNFDGYKDITVSDKVGNTSTCSALVQVKRNDDGCLIKYSGGVKGDNGWYKAGTSKTNPVKVTASCDNSYDCLEQNVEIGEYYKDGEHSFSHQLKTKDGGYLTCSGNVKIDTTSPVCTSSGGSNSWTNNNVKLVGKCNEEDCDSVEKVINYETNSSISPGIVKDKAGNSMVCPKQNVKIDKTSPVVTITSSSDSYKLSATVTDKGGSGILSQGFSGAANKNGIVNGTGGDAYYTAVDNAGNKTTKKISTYKYCAKTKTISDEVKAYKWNYVDRDCSGSDKVRNYKFNEVYCECVVDQKNNNHYCGYDGYNDVTSKTHESWNSKSGYAIAKIHYKNNSDGKKACNNDGNKINSYVSKVCTNGDSSKDGSGFHGYVWYSGSVGSYKQFGSGYYSNVKRNGVLINTSKMNVSSLKNACISACRLKYNN